MPTLRPCLPKTLAQCSVYRQRSALSVYRQRSALSLHLRSVYRQRSALSLQTALCAQFTDDAQRHALGTQADATIKQ